MTPPNVPTPLPFPTAEVAGKSLLVVDDEPVIRMIARTCLSGAGFLVTEADDRAGVFTAIANAAKPFDLILLDLTLGETKGAELIPAIRQQSPSTRILVVSGLGAEDIEGMGADGFLGKPFTKTSLLIAVWQTLTKNNVPSPEATQDG